MKWRQRPKRTPKISISRRRPLPIICFQQKRGLAFDAFRTSLEERLKAEGKVKIYPEKMRGFGGINFPNS